MLCHASPTATLHLFLYGHKGALRALVGDADALCHQFTSSSLRRSVLVVVYRPRDHPPQSWHWKRG